MTAADVISTYLRQCRVRNTLIESEGVHVPPTPEEVDSLLGYLRDKGVNPAVVGGVGLLHHLGPENAKSFRPTVDIDLWVNKVPKPPSGWRQDPEAVGVDSWISPSGGYVDFVTPSHEFEPGNKAPKKIEVDAGTRFPVGSWKSLMWLKLQSFREKDLADVIALVRKLGRVPAENEFGFFGKMTQTQRENLDMVRQWFQLRPTGTYGT